MQFIQGHDDIVALLLKNSANVEGGGSITPLLSAAMNGNTATLKLLLDYGANPNVNFCGIAPLFEAVERGNKAIVKLLLAQPNIDKYPQHRW